MKEYAKLIFIISFLFLNIGLAKNLEIGVKAPDFILKTGDDKIISLAQIKDIKNLIEKLCAEAR